MTLSQAETYIARLVYVVMSDQSLFIGHLNALHGVVGTVIDEHGHQVRAHISFIHPYRSGHV